jgi:SpoVK/Ycf46/Vps4 family AAA+-type ATPase
VTSQTANWRYLLAEFNSLNRCLARELRRQQRAGAQSKQIDQLQGLVVRQEDVLNVLASSEAWRPGDGDGDAALVDDVAELERLRAEHSTSAWLNPVHLSTTFDLNRTEERCLLLCLAAEIDPSVGKVFAYLEDDISRRLPSVGLALRLFAAGGEDRVAARALFHPSASLLSNRLLLIDELGAGGPLMTRQLRIDDRIAGYLLGVSGLDERLARWADLVLPSLEPVRTPVPQSVREYAVNLLESAFAGGQVRCRPVLHLYGGPGSGRRSLAEHVCQRLGLPLLVADAHSVPGSPLERADVLWRLARESLLQPAALLVEHFDDLLADDRALELSGFVDAALEFAPLTFLSGSNHWSGTAALRRRFFVSVACPVPPATARVGLWTEHLTGVPHEATPQDLVELATKFHLTDGQIERVVGLAQSRSAWHGKGRVQAADLSRACRTLAAPNLGDLAQHIEPGYDWSDIVLPDDQILQLRELLAHVTRAQTVLDAWGFGRKLPYGRGIGALFEGPSGTGKTMAAQIMAGQLELDLFKIDLSAVVSKYIGETEKNLGRVFTEAQSANAILFFDEADALFAKRSELAKGDAHDRYANMETAYLLQRIEDYSGVVILATNFKQNLDEAFIRRLRFIIHFPFPDDQHRLKIWTQVFPREAPLGSDVDFRWLARKLKIAGGHIRSISVRAAYLAAARQTSIDMACIREAARRELEKFGKTWTPGESAGGAGRSEEAVA